jgi:hypothetical protein
MREGVAWHQGVPEASCVLEPSVSAAARARRVAMAGGVLLLLPLDPLCSSVT